MTLTILLGEFGLKEVIIATIALLPLQFLPTILAFTQKKQHRIGIMLVNILTGWTGIGWIAALVWVLADKRDERFTARDTGM